jgi:DnaJ domain/DnaJ central domain
VAARDAERPPDEPCVELPPPTVDFPVGDVGDVDGELAGGGGDEVCGGAPGGGGGVTCGRVTSGGGGGDGGAGGGGAGGGGSGAGGGGGSGGGGSLTVGVVTGSVGVVIVSRSTAPRPGPAAIAASTPAPARTTPAATPPNRLRDIKAVVQLFSGLYGCGLRGPDFEEQDGKGMADAMVRHGRDYYEVLGVSRDADGETIKRAFRAAARALHPDVSEDPGAAEKFNELSEAYSVLSKSSTRLLYDRFGYRGRGNGWFSPEGAKAARDFLRRRNPPVAEILLDEYEAARGARRRVQWQRRGLCAACSGSGAAPGAISMVCPACEGTGRTRTEGSLSEGGRLLQIGECPTCAGQGRLLSESCSACGGDGLTSFEERAEVYVPAGTADGDRLPVQDESSRDVVVVRILAAPADHAFVRYVAVAGLAVALVFLWLLLR